MACIRAGYGPEAIQEEGPLIDRAAHRKRSGYDGVVVTTPVSIPYERYSAQPAHWWLGRALSALGSASGLVPKDIDGLCVSSFSLAPDTAVGLTQHFGLTTRFLEHLPVGGASGVIALRRAARAVQSGDAAVIACLAGDTNQVDSFRSMLANFSRFAQDASLPYGAGGPNGSFALITREYMRAFGIGREEFGKLCVAQRYNALHYPHALMTTELTLQQYLDGRKIADPITLFDCVMPCAGAEGYLVMHEEVALDRGLPFARILSTIERHNAYPDDPVQIRGGWALDAAEFWSMAGVTPDQVDMLQTYDDYPAIVAMQIEDLGFCAKGEAAEFIRSHSFTFDGSFPHNTSGGQLSVGQAGAAGGYLGLVEALRQLTGTAGANAVTKTPSNASPNAQSSASANAPYMALSNSSPAGLIAAVSGFGMINFDRGLCSAAAILAGGSS